MIRPGASWGTARSWTFGQAAPPTAGTWPGPTGPTGLDGKPAAPQPNEIAYAVDEIGLYERALTPAEVRILAGLDAVPADLAKRERPADPAATPAATVTLTPGPQLNGINGVAFDPSRGVAWVTHGTGGMSKVSYPDFQTLGRYRFTGTCGPVALDVARNRLYVVVQSPTGPRPTQPAKGGWHVGNGALHRYDLDDAPPTDPKSWPLLKPAAEVPLPPENPVTALTVTPDGEWVCATLQLKSARRRSPVAGRREVEDRPGDRPRRADRGRPVRVPHRPRVERCPPDDGGRPGPVRAGQGAAAGRDAGVLLRPVLGEPGRPGDRVLERADAARHVPDRRGPGAPPAAGAEAGGRGRPGAPAGGGRSAAVPRADPARSVGVPRAEVPPRVRRGRRRGRQGSGERRGGRQAPRRRLRRRRPRQGPAAGVRPGGEARRRDPPGPGRPEVRPAGRGGHAVHGVGVGPPGDRGRVRLRGQRRARSEAIPVLRPECPRLDAAWTGDLGQRRGKGLGRHRPTHRWIHGLTAGRWNHVAVVRDGTNTVRVVANGEDVPRFQGNDRFDGELVFDKLAMHSYGGTTANVTDVDEFCLFDQVLTDEELGRLAALPEGAVRPRPEPGAAPKAGPPPAISEKGPPAWPYSGRPVPAATELQGLAFYLPCTTLQAGKTPEAVSVTDAAVGAGAELVDDVRGKALRITPQADGTGVIPDRVDSCGVGRASSPPRLERRRASSPPYSYRSPGLGMSLADGAALKAAAGKPFTLATWARVLNADRADNPVVLAAAGDDPQPTQEFVLVAGRGAVELRLGDRTARARPGVRITGKAPDPGRWFHLAVTRDEGGQVRLLVDGVALVPKGEPIFPHELGYDRVRVAGGVSRTPAMDLAEFAFYDRAPTDAEIRRLAGSK